MNKTPVSISRWKYKILKGGHAVHREFSLELARFNDYTLYKHYIIAWSPPTPPHPTPYRFALPDLRRPLWSKHRYLAKLTELSNIWTNAMSWMMGIMYCTWIQPLEMLWGESFWSFIHTCTIYYQVSWPD